MNNKLIKKTIAFILSLFLGVSVNSFLFAETWKIDSQTVYHGGNDTNADRVKAITWSNTAALLDVEVYQVIFPGWTSEDPIIINPGVSKTITGVNVSVDYNPSAYILNSTTRHGFNGYHNLIKDLS